MMEELTGQTPDAATFAQQSQTGLMAGAVLTVIALVLALVQWRKPNGVLPILFLVLVIWSLGGAALALVIPALLFLCGSGPLAVWLRAQLWVAQARRSGPSWHRNCMT
jgi:hypothetical protein